MAAAEVKPEMTGKEMKSTMNPDATRDKHRERSLVVMREFANLLLSLILSHPPLHTHTHTHTHIHTHTHTHTHSLIVTTHQVEAGPCQAEAHQP